MPTLDQTNDALDATISDIVAKFNKGTESTEKGVFNAVIGMVKELDLDKTGNIKQTQKNIRMLNKIRSKVEPIVLNDDYKKRVREYMGGFKDVQIINDNYLNEIAASFNPSPVLQQQIMKYELEVTGNSLVGAGISEEVIDPVKKIIQDSVMNGGAYGDLVEQLRMEIKGIEGERLGRLSRYTGQIATDAMNQYSRNYVQTIGKDLGFEWYYYSGGLKGTSRKYCKKRAGRHFHIEEIEESSHQKWAGKIPSTNESNILTYCGGYNCRHRYLPTDSADVPAATSANRMIKLSKKEYDSFDKTTKQIAKRHGAMITPTNMKKRPSMVRKANADFNGDSTQVKDSIRTTIITPYNKRNAVIDDLQKKGMVERLKRQNFDTGYTGVLMNTKTGQYIEKGKVLQGEIQVNTPGMIFAKESRS